MNIKGMILRTVVRLAMMYGLKILAMTKERSRNEKAFSVSDEGGQQLLGMSTAEEH